MLKRLSLIALLALCAPAIAGIYVKVAIGPSDLVDTGNRTGAATGGTCPDGWTCSELGDASCDVDEVDANTFTIAATGGTNDEGNICFVHKTAATDSDIHLEALIPDIANWVGTPEDFSGCGVAVVDSGGYQSHTWWPNVGTARFKTDASGAGKASQSGASGQFTPYYVGYEYDDSATEETGWESSDAWTTDFVIGSPVTKSLTFPVDYGVFCTSHDTGSTLSVTVDGIVANTTLAFSDDPGEPDPPTGNDHVIATGTSTVDCQALGVEPSDTITMDGTSRGPVQWKNCFGTAEDPITVRNDTTESGPLVISTTGSGFKSRCTNCQHVVIDGTGKWSGAPAGSCGITVSGGSWTTGTTQCGIQFRCDSGAPHSLLRFDGSSRFVTVKGFKADGNFPTCTNGIPIDVQDHDYERDDHPGEWREGFKFTQFFVDNAYNTALYIGPNQGQEGLGDLFLRNNEFSYGYILDSGTSAIKLKSTIEGSSSIHHLLIQNTGIKGDGGDAIELFESGHTDVYNNRVRGACPSGSSGGSCNCIVQIASNLSSSTVATLPANIYGNDLHQCHGNGIFINRKKSSNPSTNPTIYNNTLVDTGGAAAINCSTLVASGTIRDNIAAGESITARSCTSTNNNTQSIANQKFENSGADDFRLTDTSPARNNGTANCPATDLLGTSRPQEGICDQGAYERP